MENFTKIILREINQTCKEEYILRYFISIYFKTRENYSVVLKVRTVVLLRKEEGGNVWEGT